MCQKRLRISIDKPYVYAELMQGPEVISTGFAKCSPMDNWEEERGIKIATGRAIMRHKRNKAKFKLEQRVLSEV